MSILTPEHTQHLADNNRAMNKRYQEDIDTIPGKIAADIERRAEFVKRGWDAMVRVMDRSIASYERRLEFAKEHIIKSEERTQMWDSRAAQERADKLDGVRR